MRESEWVEIIADRVRRSAADGNVDLDVRVGLKLPYGYEIQEFTPEPRAQMIDFETDFAVVERDGAEKWKPRVVIEAKLKSVTTHDAITYSSKASAHKSVHPYLRYGIMLGDRGRYPLPGRLYRHGSNFDFMFSFREDEPDDDEMQAFLALLTAEVSASRMLEKLLYESRKPGRERYTVLHRRLILGGPSVEEELEYVRPVSSNSRRDTESRHQSIGSERTVSEERSPNESEHSSSGGVQTSQERIVEALEVNPNGMCDDCLSKLAGVQPRQQVNQIAQAL